MHAHPYQTCSKKTWDVPDLETLTWILQFHSLRDPIGSVIFWDNLGLTQKAADMLTLVFTKVTAYDGKKSRTNNCAYWFPSFIYISWISSDLSTGGVFCNILVAQSSAWNCIISNSNGKKTDFTHMDSLTHSLGHAHVQVVWPGSLQWQGGQGTLAIHHIICLLRLATTRCFSDMLFVSIRAWQEWWYFAFSTL